MATLHAPRTICGGNSLISMRYMGTLQHNTQQPLSGTQGEIVLYQPDETIRLEVRMEDETVWLTQAQMAELFQTTRNNATLHIGNIFKEGELEQEEVCKESLLTASDGKRYKTKLYNLDVIISVGYRVKSKRGTQFRQWANKVLKEYLLRGYSINYHILQIEKKYQEQNDVIQDIKNTLTAHQQKIDFFVHSSLPPVEGIFFDGQIFDAYRFVSDLVRKAKQAIILIDNYVDDTVLALLDKRNSGVSATIYTQHVGQQLQLDLQRHNAQYSPITIENFNRAHDRFLLIDNEVYHIGASLKDLGKKWFAFTKMQDLTSEELINKIR